MNACRRGWGVLTFACSMIVVTPLNIRKEIFTQCVPHLSLEPFMVGRGRGTGDVRGTSDSRVKALRNRII